MSKAKLSEKRLAEQKRKRKGRRRDKKRGRVRERNEEDAWLRWIENGNRQ